MANRFLDTNFYKSPFVRGLEGPLKSLYCFIICDCDGAGIWNLDLPAANLYIGFEITHLQFKKSFIDTNKAIDIEGNKYFFPDFIEHQYPNGLQENNKAHKNFIKVLKRYELLNDDLSIKNKGASKGLQSPPCIGIGNGNGNGLKEGCGEENEIDLKNHDKNWNQHPGKELLNLELDKTKGGAVKELFSFSKNHKLTDEELGQLWNIFKIQNFTGEKFYQTKNKVYSHFINWSKTQNINGTKQQKSAGRNIIHDEL